MVSMCTLDDIKRDSNHLTCILKFIFGGLEERVRTMRRRFGGLDTYMVVHVFMK